MSLPLSQCQPHPSLWFDDGNVVISHENTLYKFGQADQLESFEGLPLVSLKTSIARNDDVKALIQHLYHDKPLRSTSSFEHTAKILRASTCLDFPQIRSFALSRLVELYARRPAPFESSKWQDLTAAAQLALDCHVRELFSALIYAMVTTLEFDIEESSEHPSPSQGAVPLSVIVAPDLHRLCIKVMNRIMDHFAPILFTVPTSSHMECTSVFADHWMNHAIQPALDDSGVYKPLETLRKVQEVDWRSLGLCESCFEDKRKEWDDEADDIWSRMDGWLDLDSIFTTSHNT